MKRIFIISLLLPLVLVGCKKGTDEPEEIKLAVEPNLINCPAFGGDYTLTLTAPEAWTASCADAWVKVNPTSGNAGTMEISVKVSANKESKESTSKIVFKSGDKTFELPVKRAAKDPARLRVTTEKEIQTPKDGGDYAIKVESNIKWSISSNVSWAKVQGDAVKRDNATINIAVNAATAPEETKALIIVSPFGEGAEAGKDTVVITRGGTDATSMTISQNEIDAPSNGGSYTINVTSNAQWRVYKSWDADWLTVTNDLGDGNGSFGIQVDAATSGNDASTVITVEEIRTDSYKPVQLNVLVTRKGKETAQLLVAPTSIECSPDGGEFAVAIKCNYPWTATLVGVRIFSVSTTKGDGDATMVVTVKPATDTKEATGHITITSNYGGEKATIMIHRQAKAAPELKLSASSVTSDFEGGKFVINVESNYSWTVKSTNTNIAQLNTTSGSAIGSFEITVPETDLSEDNQAYVVVTTDFGNYSRSIVVTRKGIPLLYTPKPFSVSATKKVYISPGNLQYNPKKQIWRFAIQQYECEAESNKYRENEPYPDTYWIDLFRSGTNPIGSCQGYGLSGDFLDWGSLYDISYNKTTYSPYTWYTPSTDELLYLFEREDGRLAGYVHIGEHDEGYMLLPDDWQLPEGVEPLKPLNNSYTMKEWKKMEAAGAILLPSGGYIYNCDYYHYGSNIVPQGHAIGSYCTSGGGQVEFSIYDVHSWPESLSSVRLVRDAE